MRAYNRGKPFTGLTTTLESTPLLKGISTRTARKLQYDVPIYIGTVHSHSYTTHEIRKAFIDYFVGKGHRHVALLWSRTEPETCRYYRDKGPFHRTSPLDFGYNPSALHGFAIEVDPPKPEYEPDAQ